MRSVRLQIILFILFISRAAYSQDSTGKAAIGQIPSKYFDAVSKKADALEQKLDKKSEKALARLQKQEEKIKRKLARIDSLAVHNMFADAEARYKQIEEKLKSSNTLTQYIPRLDTLVTSFKFLEQNKEWLSQAKDAREKLNDAFSKVKELESWLQKAEEIKQFLRERREYLKSQLSQLGFTKELKKINKQVYYYSQQINEYKSILNNPRKIEKKAIELLSKTKLFQDFMKKNSMLASLFPMPAGNLNGQTVQVGFAAIQTRSQLNSFIQQASMGNINLPQQFQQNIQSAQVQINDIRQKLSQLIGSGNEDLTILDFKPNTQKTKSFFKKLEYGTSFQSQPARGYFPVTTDFGLSVGYKLNDKSIIGLGASYKMGWGTGWNNIRITHSGIGIRSFLDWKIKGEFWLSGGYERNYRTEFKSINQLRNLNAWQQSGLIGVSKTFKLKMKILRSSKLQFLWDYLSYNQRPQTQPLLFRIGYNF